MLAEQAETLQKGGSAVWLYYTRSMTIQSCPHHRWLAGLLNLKVGFPEPATLYQAVLSGILQEHVKLQFLQDEFDRDLSVLTVLKLSAIRQAALVQSDKGNLNTA